MDSVLSQSEDAFLVAYLQDRDVECPICQYNLRNLLTPKCPECGEPLVLQIRSAEPRHTAFFIGLIGLAAGAGLNGLLTIYGIAQAIIRPGDMWLRFFYVTGGGLLVLAPLTLLLVVKRRWFWRQSRAKRTLLASLCWILTLIDLAIFTFSLR